jgi:hypothetical protein
MGAVPSTPGSPRARPGLSVPLLKPVPPEPRLLQLDPQTLCFSAAGMAPSKAAVTRKEVEPEQVTRALTDLGQQARHNQLPQQVMDDAECSKRTAQLAIAEACRQGSIVQADGQYRLPL